MTLDEWIVAGRPARNNVDARRPYEFFVEEECAEGGEVVPVATVFLTNRECPWRCLMCDLWRNTLTERVPAGAICEQIDFALTRLPAARHIKLYNSGSFFDAGAIPPDEYPAIAARIAGFERVIVESHPALIGEGVMRFRDALNGARLEVAMGLETAHREILARLNKRMSLEQFRRAAEELRRQDVDLRSFAIVKPPYMSEAEASEWAARSIDFAFDCGSSAVTLIPARGGNGAMERLAESGDFSPPRLATLEASLDYGIEQRRGRVFADVWDLRRADECGACFDERAARLRAMNLRQEAMPYPVCKGCAIS